MTAMRSDVLTTVAHLGTHPYHPLCGRPLHDRMLHSCDPPHLSPARRRISLSTPVAFGQQNCNDASHHPTARSRDRIATVRRRSATACSTGPAVNTADPDRHRPHLTDSPASHSAPDREQYGRCHKILVYRLRRHARPARRHRDSGLAYAGDRSHAFGDQEGGNHQ